jgi:hypothetical protein
VCVVRQVHHQITESSPLHGKVLADGLHSSVLELDVAIVVFDAAYSQEASLRAQQPAASHARSLYGHTFAHRPARTPPHPTPTPVPTTPPCALCFVGEAAHILPPKRCAGQRTFQLDGRAGAPACGDARWPQSQPGTARCSRPEHTALRPREARLSHLCV